MPDRAEGEKFGKLPFLTGLERKSCFLYIKANFNQNKDILKFLFSPEAGGDEGESPWP